MSDSTIRALLGGPIVAFHTRLVPVLGSIPAVLMLQQLVYASERGVDEKGWFEQDMDWFTETTGLSRWQQRRARAHLRHLGVITETRRGTPARLAYRIHFPELETLLQKVVTDVPNRTSRSEVSAHQDVKFPRISFLSSNTKKEYEEGPPVRSATRTSAPAAQPWEPDLYRLGWANDDRLDERQVERIVKDHGTLDIADEIEKFVAYWSHPQNARKVKTWVTYARLRTWFKNAEDRAAAVRERSKPPEPKFVDVEEMEREFGLK